MHGPGGGNFYGLHKGTGRIVVPLESVAYRSQDFSFLPLGEPSQDSLLDFADFPQLVQLLSSLSGAWVDLHLREGAEMKKPNKYLHTGHFKASRQRDLHHDFEEFLLSLLRVSRAFQ